MTFHELMTALSDPRIRHEMIVQYAFLLGAMGWALGMGSIYLWATKEKDEYK